MKNLIILISMIISLNACAMGSKLPDYPARKGEDKLYRPCSDKLVGNPVGKLCNRSCIERKGDECKQWKLTIKDFNDPETFKWFRSATFIMIAEDQVL